MHTETSDRMKSIPVQSQMRYQFVNEAEDATPQASPTITARHNQPPYNIRENDEANETSSSQSDELQSQIVLRSPENKSSRRVVSETQQREWQDSGICTFIRCLICKILQITVMIIALSKN